MKKERLRIESMRKGILLERIHLRVFEGEIVHCVFDNLQEKLAFIEIIAGRSLADYGKVYYNEQRIPEEQTRQLFKEKISVITNESNLIDSVTIAENIFLISPVVAQNWLNHRKFKREAVALFQEFGVDVNIRLPVRKLSVFEKLQVELLKAYLNGQEIIILTELCNLLSDKERKSIMVLLKKLQKKGISCMILEPLEDIDFSTADSVIIIKHGKTCLIKETEECDYTFLHRALYYDELRKRTRENALLSSSVESDDSVRIENLTSDYLKNISIEVKKGEIVKVFCVDEKSYYEFADILKGKTELNDGVLMGAEYVKTFQKNFQGLKNGIGIVEGNPATATLFKELTVMDNLQMLLSRKVKLVWMAPKYRRSIKLILQDVIPEQIFRKKIKDLSPPDVQKVLYSKWMLYSPELLICIQPFAEGNIEARETARKMVYMLKERGIPILIITSNSAEFNYCIGREVFVQHGRIIAKEKAYRFLYSEGE